MKLKARSRLTSGGLPRVAGSSLIQPKSHSFRLVKPQFNFHTSPAWWVKRQSKLPILIIGLALYGYLYYILTHFFPVQVQDWLIPGSFLPVLGLAALGHIYVGSFITLNTRRAVLISVGLSWLLWLQLHQFVVDWIVTGYSFLAIIIVEISFYLIKKITNR